MSIRIYSAHHRRHGLETVRSAGVYARVFSDALREQFPGSGVVTLATCNRVEVLLDTDTEYSASLAPEGHWNVLEGDQAIEHIFAVAAGLDSMVVGEREIAGQLRRALNSAQDRGLASPALQQLLQAALKTSRRVAHETRLGQSGRTVATVALDLVHTEWPTARVLVLGTGSYAGAVVADLRTRGASRITIHSVSGRGAAFAASHQIEHASDLATALREADVIITCRGIGEHIITSADLEDLEPKQVVDLALDRDVDPAVAELAHIRLITLSDIARHTDPSMAQDQQRAEQIVRDGIEAYHSAQAGRALDPAVVELRTTIHDMVSDEIARLPQHRELTADDAAAALRRLAGRFLHEPSSRAKLAAEAGRSHEYLDALAALHGIDIRSVTQESV